MDQTGKKTYVVKDPRRLTAIVAVAASLLVLILLWALLLGRIRRRTADLAAYTTLTRTGETVTAVLDLDSLLTELKLPNPRTEPKAARNGAVKALLNMRLDLAFTETPDVMTVAVTVNEGALRRRGIALRERAWTGQVKVLPRTGAQEETPLPAQEGERPKTVLEEGYLASLLDREGKGLNLRPVCERVRFERDRLAKEIFGSSQATKKIGVWFILFPEGSPRRNVYRAVFSLTETGNPEGRSVGSCFFTVDVEDLTYGADAGVAFAKTDVALYDTQAEAEDLSALLAQGCAVTRIVGGSVPGPARPSFDYSGFVRFVGRPMSHPLPDGAVWSPSYDPLDEDDLWRLVDNGEYTMVELLNFVRMEIYARRGYTFPNPGQEVYREHFSACDWYRPTEDSPERFMTPTERRNLELLQDMVSLLEQ